MVVVPTAHDINYVHNLLEMTDGKVRVAHVYRVGNRGADWLDNQGVTQENNLLILENIPIGLRRILKEDVRGVAFTRFIPP